MNNITIYSTPTCGYCQIAKSYFAEKNLEYTEYNVAEDQKKATEMLEKSGQMGVPVIVVNDKLIVGFNKEEIEKLLK